uniref:Uncharacterized protein n=1 Tax=Micrurus surinamensis TaxID=129470 RepID=A0A2D4NZK8_MICSU
MHVCNKKRTEKSKTISFQPRILIPYTHTQFHLWQRKVWLSLLNLSSSLCPTQRVGKENLKQGIRSKHVIAPYLVTSSLLVSFAPLQSMKALGLSKRMKQGRVNKHNRN